MIFEGFEGPFSQSKSIKNRFHVELAMKVAPRRPQDVSRRPQDAPKTPQDSQDGPKTRPRRPQDAPRTPQDAPQGAENFKLKNGFLADPLHRRSQDAPRLPRRPQDGPKTRPRRPQDAPRTPQDAPQGASTVAGTRHCRAEDNRIDFFLLLFEIIFKG